MKTSNQDQSQEISSFLSKYALTQINSETTIIQSSNSVYLSKSIQLDREQIKIDDVIESLQQHQILNPSYLLTLISYQLTKSKSNSLTIKTLYQYSKLSLEQEISNRKQINKHFTQEELWAIIYSLVKSLHYLQSLGIAYGVLGCDKIFIDKKIKLLDPSAVGEDPFSIVSHRLYSPQILNQYSSPDILKSDIYTLGLCILQAALLLSQDSLKCEKYDQNRIKLYLEQFQSFYPSELTTLIIQMLEYQPQSRPSFSQIIEFLQNTLEMTDYSEDCFDPLPQDNQDKANQIQLNSFTQETEICDGEEQEQQCFVASFNEFQRAKIKFLNHGSPSDFKQISKIQQISAHNSSINLQFSQRKCNRSSLISRKNPQSFNKNQTSKSIKYKVIKDMNLLDLEITDLKQSQNIPYKPNDYNHIFTSPRLMQEIQISLKNIATNRGVSKQNLYNCNY